MWSYWGGAWRPIPRLPYGPLTPPAVALELYDYFPAFKAWIGAEVDTSGTSYGNQFWVWV